MTDFETPNIDFSNRDAALQQIWSFVLSFQEQVSFWLRNLDKDSFNAQGLAEITAPISAEIEDVAGNVTTLQVTAEGLQSQVTEADGKASSAKQTADGVQVEVNGLKSRNTVTIDSTGLYVTDAAGNTTKLSGNHITSGTIEGVTLISRENDGVATSIQSVTIENGKIELKSPNGDTATIAATYSGLQIESSTFSGGGVTISAPSVVVSGELNAGSAKLNGDITVAQNINSNGIMKLNAGGNASFDANGTLYLASNGGDVVISNGGTINLKGTVLVNGSPLTAGSST